MPAQRLRIGLIGAGRIGRLHAENLVFRIPTAQLVAIADVSLAAAQDTARRLQVPAAYQDYHDLLGDPGIDAVAICSTTGTHARIIQEAAAADKHIFCEKPIDHSLTSIDQALAAVSRAGVKLQIGFNRRFDASFRRVRQAIESGEIGQPHLLHIVSRDPAPPPLDYVKVSGGLFLDMTIHDFDMARYLVGCEVTEIYAAADVRIDSAITEADDLDTAVLILRFADGCLGTIDNSRQAVYGYDQRVEVLGSRGSIRIDNNYPNTAVVSTDQHVRRDLPLNFFLERYTESYVREMAEFVTAVVEDRPTPVGGIDGRIPVVMGLAARRSYDENRPIRLEEIQAG